MYLLWASSLTTCTRETIHEEEEKVTSSFCGKPAIVIYIKQNKTYPLCEAHDSNKAREWAIQYGYDINEVISDNP